MKFDAAASLLDGIPYMNAVQGREIYEFILAKRPAESLELGFAHGVSSCYIAAALDEIGSGHHTAVDLAIGATWQEPSIEQLLAKTGLESYVTVCRERTSYTWFLKKQIEERTVDHHCEPRFDFCFIDGAKNWTIDGLAFFLVDKLLKPEGVILFDDLNWSYRRYIASGQAEVDGVSIAGMGDDEIDEPHVAAIFRLLVMQHPDYSDFKIEGDWWGWAHKTNRDSRRLTIDEHVTLRRRVLRAIRRIRGVSQ